MLKNFIFSVHGRENQSLDETNFKVTIKTYETKKDSSFKMSNLNVDFSYELNLDGRMVHNSEALKYACLPDATFACSIDNNSSVFIIMNTLKLLYGVFNTYIPANDKYSRKRMRAIVLDVIRDILERKLNILDRYFNHGFYKEHPEVEDAIYETMSEIKHVLKETEDGK